MSALQQPFFLLIAECPVTLGPDRQSALGRTLLARLLVNHFGIDPLPEMRIRDDGKPYFPHHPRIRFNISHCRTAVMAVVSAVEIGCDIEDIACAPPDKELLDLAFSEREKSAICRSGNPAVKLTQIWTRKEACVKCSGLIPDDPARWPSSSPGLSTFTPPGKPYVYSICTSPG